MSEQARAEGLDAVDVGTFKAAIGSFATGVTVATTASAFGPHGVTANAVMSVSLNPPLVALAVRIGSRMQAALRRSDNFALSILASGQREAAGYFADSSRPHGAPGFALFAHHAEVTGAPLLEGALAWIDCRIVAVHAVGDHDLFVGQALLARSFAPGTPLLYYRGAFGSQTFP
jgi:flavin reductase (DIM6/NTAB) family NADH-FMN oxidoreductase RutF